MAMATVLTVNTGLALPRTRAARDQPRTSTKSLYKISRSNRNSHRQKNDSDEMSVQTTDSQSLTEPAKTIADLTDEIKSLI